MNFISLSYFVFLPCALLVYWLTPKKARQYVLLALSLFFYARFGAKLLCLLVPVVLLTYACAAAIPRFPSRKRLFAALAAVFSLLPLVFYKYIGLVPGAVSAALPVGLSFYAFQALGYVIDVYRGAAPERNIFRYALFVSFFPQLGSGPIGRSAALLPQYREGRAFSPGLLRDGITPLLWGFFKKLVIADRMATAVAAAYSAPGNYSGLELLFATVLFSVQIYCDFSAYTDIARGSAKMFGIDLAQNFDAPYLASSVRDFWRRWHMSLTGWFRDYLYFPLGGSRKGRLRTALNTLAVFGVSGMWHGSSPTFLVWGLLNGLYLIAFPGRKKKKTALGRLAGTVFTFALITLSWVFFRADSLGDAFHIIKAFAAFPLKLNFTFSLSALGLTAFDAWLFAACAAVLTAADAALHFRGLAARLGGSVFARYAVWFVLICAVLLLGAYGPGFTSQEFVYFKF